MKRLITAILFLTLVPVALEDEIAKLSTLERLFK